MVCLINMKWIYFLFFIITSTWLQGNSVINAGDLTWHAGATEKPIRIESHSPEVEILAKKAFSTHGAYTIARNDNDAMYIFKLNKESTQTISLVIELAKSQQIQYSTIVKGKDWKHAVLKACDIAVQKTLGVPGYFSGKIIFVGDRGQGKELYMGDLFFQEVKQITHDKSDPIMPRISPDGKHILYTSYYKTGFPDIFKITIQTGQRKCFAAYKGINTGGVYNPSGTSVAMILSSSGVPELYIADKDGRNPKRMTHTKSLKATPSWSPNGRKIVYVSDQVGGPQLFELNVESGSTQRIPTNLSGYCAEPDWNSLYDNQIIFTGAVNKTFQIALYDAKKGSSRFVTQGNMDALEPCWTLDGRHVIFTQRNKSDKKLYILDTISGKKSMLSPKDFGNASMACFVK